MNPCRASASASASASSSASASGCTYGAVALLVVGGVVALVAAAFALRDGHRSSSPVVVPLVAAAGLLLGAGALGRTARKLARNEAEDARQRLAFPDEPWRWRKEWRGERIEAEDRQGLLPLWMFVLVWNGISAPAVVQFIQRQPEDKIAYVVFLFPLLGLGLLAGAIHLTLRLRKYGRVRFAPALLPGVIGGHLGGVIEVPARVVALGNMRLALRCVHKIVRGTGKSRRVIEAVLWETEETLPPEKQSTAIGRTEIPVLFAIPPGLRPSALDEPNNQVLWRLTAEAATPGVDFACRFHVPVFAVPELASATATGLGGAGTHHAPAATSPLDDETLRAASVERRIDGWRFGARHLWLTNLIASVVFFGLLGLLGSFAVEGAHPAAWFFVSLFALLPFIACYDLWHGSYEFRVVGGEAVVVYSRWFRRRRVRLRCADIADVRVEKSISVGATQHHRLVLVGRPVGDPNAPAHANEPFATRKLRRRLARFPVDGDASALRARLAAAPRFEVRVAGHLPGPYLSARLHAEVFACVAGPDLPSG